MFRIVVTNKVYLIRTSQPIAQNVAVTTRTRGRLLYGSHGLTQRTCHAFLFDDSRPYLFTSALGSRNNLAYSTRDAFTKASSSSFSSTSTSRTGLL